MSTADQVLQALRSFDLKEERNGKYRCNSPFRPGSNSHAFNVQINGPEHGTYFDHVSQERGSLYDLAAHLGIAVPTTTQIADTKRKYEGLEDYARAHGIPPHVLEYWQWREVMVKDRKALEFSTRTGKRWRFLDGKKPHYKSELNYQQCWYGFTGVVLDRLKSGQPLVLCNGEISTITAQHYNLAAIAITGGEKSEIPTALLSEMKGKLADIEGLSILVAMDCDSAGRRAGRGIAAQLVAEGYSARAVDLQMSNGGDLADFCTLYTSTALEMLLHLPDLPPTTEEHEITSRFFDIDGLMNLPGQRWLLRGKIPERGLCMVFGASGVGKSFYALDLAMEIALNHSVIYVVAEGETGMSSRVRAYMNHHQIKPAGIRFFLGSIDLFQEEDNYTWQSLAAAYKPKLIVIDTLAMCSGAADENSTRDMKIIVDSSKRIATDLDTAVLIVHHTNKGGKEVRGNMSLFNACDTVIRVSKSDDLVIVESKKTKDLEPFSPYYLKPLPVLTGRVDQDGEQITSLVLVPADKIIEGDNLTDLQMKVLDALAVSPNLSIRELADMTESSAPAIQRAIKRLESLELIEPYDGSQRSVTEKGRETLDANTAVSGVSGVSGVSRISGESKNGVSPKVADTPDTPIHPNQDRLFGDDRNHYQYNN